MIPPALAESEGREYEVDGFWVGGYEDWDERFITSHLACAK